MIHTLRQIRARIRSVSNVKKITQAMEMVSSAKLNKIKGAFHSSHPYFLNLEYILKNFLSDLNDATHPFLGDGNDPEKTVVCIIASDTGLCGNYNHNIITAAEMFLERFAGSQLKLVTVGKEASSYFRGHGYKIAGSHLGLYGRYSAKFSQELSRELTTILLNNEAEQIFIVYTRLSTKLHHAPVIDKFLPIECDSSGERRYILEPDERRILDQLIPKYLAAKMNDILLDALTSENSARMFAMKIATDNAEELISTLTLMRNKARQAAITKEVLEIALSAEALKG